MRRHARGGLRPLPSRYPCTLCHRLRRLARGRVYCRRCARKYALPGFRPSAGDVARGIEDRLIRTHLDAAKEATKERNAAVAEGRPVPGRVRSAALAAMAMLWDVLARRKPR